MEKLSKKRNYSDLKFVVQSAVKETDFTKVDDPIVFPNNIEKGKTTKEKTKNLQEEFNK